jgi:hypothetical protein
MTRLIRGLFRQDLTISTKILQGKDHHCGFITKGFHPRPSSPIQSFGTGEIALPFRVAFPNMAFTVRS